MTTSQMAHSSISDKDAPIDTMLGLSITVLTALSNVAVSSPIAPAATICLGILTTASNAKGNNENFRELARDACELVYAVKCQGDSAQTRSPSFQKQVENLVQVLEKIKKFSEKRAAKWFVLRLLTISLDADKIKKYRAELEQRLKVFNLQSNVSIREMVEEMLKRPIDRSCVIVTGNGNTVTGVTFVNGDMKTYR
ncbi:hypothetical protein MSAN_00973300 [Mycena sanguinolenta]|uniref:Uncharacterized protein n=1 Tax=Mycena sanguinolenta TaxID=230812 RepID=A0A8H7DD24_9AGAR|nr:hypothetical protein MSAN_00973300 [Mycena sanguinolenta]